MSAAALLTGTAFGQLNASFTSAPGANNGDVDFTNTSTGTTAQTTYYWNFGDGGSSNAEHPSHTYTQDGVYSVTLTAIDSSLMTSHTYSDSVAISGLGGGAANCNANFYWWQPQDSLTGAYSSDVYLVNTATGNNLTYTWNFGDGSTGTGAYPVHVYSNVGMYVVCLTIDDGAGCTDTYCDTLTVYAKVSGFTLNVIDQSQVGSVGVEEVTTVTVNSLYPNPVRENATLQINALDNKEVLISILDLTGKVISTNNEVLSAGNNNILLETTTLPKGMYMVNLRTMEGDFATTLQFVKQ